MSTNTKISLAIVGLVAAVVGVLLVLTQPGTPPANAERGPGADGPPTAPASVLIRPDSHRLSGPADDENAKVTVVEFLDLECEACGAAFPGVERLREEYGDRVTFVLRYFPVPSHPNAELAATAVEAAGRQDKLDEMYQLMYETQPLWSHQQTSQRATFLRFARQLGLDLERFTRDLDDPATLERVVKDREDGVALGVRGTPTFFINGRAYQGQPSYEGLKGAIDSALAG